VAAEASFAGIVVLGHRALGQVAALVGVDHDATRAAGHGKGDADRECEPGQIPHAGDDHITRVAWRPCGDPLYTSRMKTLLVLLVTLAACAAPQEEAVKPPPGPSASPVKASASGDVSVEIPVIEIKGILHEPEALGQPGMPLVEAKKKTPLDKQRALVRPRRIRCRSRRRRPCSRRCSTWSPRTTRPTRSSCSETRARSCATSPSSRAKAIDEITLRLLGSYELLLEDYPAAEKAWQMLIDYNASTNTKNTSKNKDDPYNRAWLGFALLKQFKNAEALAAVASEKLDEKEPELAYVIAWARWRNNDAPGAWQAVTTAAKAGARTPSATSWSRTCCCSRRAQASRSIRRSPQRRRSPRPASTSTS